MTQEQRTSEPALEGNSEAKTPAIPKSAAREGRATDVRQNDLRRLVAPVARELELSSAGLLRELDSDSEAVRDVVSQLHCVRGKRLRAACVLLVGRACLGDRPMTPAHLEIASIVELIHMATLVHDDVLDRADVRRTVETVNSRFGNEVAVLLGDWIYARAFSISTRLDDQTCSRVLSDVTATICRGEIEQSRAKYDFGLDEARYLETIEAKTASLYASSCELGARYAMAADSVVAAARRFGLELGIAFQIVDDCLDLDGSEDVVGKSLGTDIAEGKITHPVIALLRTAPPRGRARIAEIFRSEGIEDRVATLWREFDVRAALEVSYGLAQRSAGAALAALEPFPPSAAKQSLVAMAEYVLSRRW